MHNFQRSLKVGQAGELLLMKYWPDLIKLDGFKSDFKLASTGQTLELKSDSYDMLKTPNFFIELWSDYDKQKPGGPAQAELHGSDLWFYWFPKNLTGFLFDTKKLLFELPDVIKGKKYIEIPNRSWTTVGVTVARASLAHLYEERKFK